MAEQSDYIGHTIPVKDSYDLTGFQENNSAFFWMLFLQTLNIFFLSLKKEIYLN
tara:strand:- start:4561 stop:4722 length:162 start_codon:yes stop_codon:yes gene_type:complete